ncbi:TolB family protein [Gemmatimonadota bacterium]
MKVFPALRSLLTVLVPFAFFVGCGGPQRVEEPEFPELAGPYLGQAPPGGAAQLFAPGIVSTGLFERDVAMTPDGSEIYWGVVGGNFTFSTVFMSRVVDGLWMEPEVAPCCLDRRWVDLEPHITPDGRQFMWLSDRPGPGRPTKGGQDIWVMDREGDAWGDPYPLPPVINSEASEYFPSVTRGGTLYFTRSPAGGGENLIFRSRRVGGEYQEPELLPPQVNSGRSRYNAFVDPDEEYLLLGVAGAEDGLGGTDYYVVFRNEEDQWSDPVNLGPTINTEGGFEYSPYVSPDGRFLFFMTVRPAWDVMAPGGTQDAASIRSFASKPDNGAWDIYWVDASFLESLRPEGF